MSVEAINHDDKRINIPPAEAAELVNEEKSKTVQLRWKRDPSLDPQLVWREKDETDAKDLVVHAPPIYIQEKVDPRVLVENLRRNSSRPQDGEELTLFNTAEFDGLTGWDAIEYYEHDANWSNRMILGDSLQVMASLAEKEDLRGKVQMIYIDPPYGIEFKSNWQVSTGKRDVKDGSPEGTSREVEQIKAFRDTWKLGISSYLSYLRDRLAVARELLTESGSVFVQIGSQNVHLVTSLLAEIYGHDNHVETIAFRKKTMPLGGRLLEGAYDYIVWFAKSKEVIKYRPLFQKKNVQGDSHWNLAVLPNGEIKTLTRAEIDNHGLLPDGADPAQLIALYPVGPFKTGIYDYIHKGRPYKLPSGKSWPTPKIGMDRLAIAGRLQPYSKGETLRYLLRLSDYPITVFNNVWTDTSAPAGMTYVVETSPKVIERCLLMTTDPGDLVLDPTCGSGTSAFVAEKWGRRWVTVDTSRVALALARQRIMGAQYPVYLLADSREGIAKESEITGVISDQARAAKRDIRKGFVYHRAAHVTLKSIANNSKIVQGMSADEIERAIKLGADKEILYDDPYEVSRAIRVAGRFTVESLSPHRTVAPDLRSESEQEGHKSVDSPSFEQTIIDNLRTSGVQNGRKKERLLFASLETHGGKYIQAFGEPRLGDEVGPERIAVSIGPQYGTVDAEWVKEAAREALRGPGAQMLLVCAFAFDPQAVPAAKDFAPSDPNNFASVTAERKLGKLPILFVRMNSDLVMGDVLLKKTKAANLFMVFGEPDIDVQNTETDQIVVEIRGMDIYNPSTGEIRPSGTNEIALWMIDTEYTEDAFFVRHCYFTGGQDPYKNLKRSLQTEIDVEAWASLNSTRSRPFPRPESGKIAVKVINHYGDEVVQVYEV